MSPRATPPPFPLAQSADAFHTPTARYPFSRNGIAGLKNKGQTGDRGNVGSGKRNGGSSPGCRIGGKGCASAPPKPRPPRRGVCACAPAAYRPTYPAGQAPRHFLATRRQIAHHDDFCLLCARRQRKRPPDRTRSTRRGTMSFLALDSCSWQVSNLSAQLLSLARSFPLLKAFLFPIPYSNWSIYLIRASRSLSLLRRVLSFLPQQQGGRGWRKGGRE